MNEDVIEDLKQFIATAVSQQIADVRSDIEKMDNKLSSDIQSLDNKLSNKIDDLSDSVAEAIQAGNDSTDAQLNDHKQRIYKLEQKLT
jgi:hypothetical protein